MIGEQGFYFERLSIMKTLTNKIKKINDNIHSKMKSNQNSNLSKEIQTDCLNF